MKVKLLHKKCLHVGGLVHVSIQDGDGFRKETVPESVCLGSSAPVASARGQQVKQVVGGMGVVSDNGLRSAEAARCVYIFEGGGSPRSSALS